MNGDFENGSLPILRTLVDSLVNTLSKLSIRQESLEKDLTNVSSLVSNLPDVKRKLDEIKDEQQEITEMVNKSKEVCEKGIKEIGEMIKPVSKLSELISKPLSIVVVLLLVISTAYGMFKMFEGVFMPQKPTPTNVVAPAQPTNSLPSQTP